MHLHPSGFQDRVDLKSLEWSCLMNRYKAIINLLFPHFVSMYVRLTKKPITDGMLDVYIEMDPLWNHVLKSDVSTFELVKKECESGDLLLSFHEAINLVWATKSTSHIFGSIAEVGTFNGGSANLILSSDLDASRKMHLFDTFAGLPEVKEGFDGTMKIGDIKGSQVSMVKLKLEKFTEKTIYHVGIFPDTTKGIPLSSRYSLVHLDADTYQTTLAALTYFYPLMTLGSFFIFHDYSSISCPGVRRAIDGFFLDKNEVVIPLWHTQALVIMQ